ncbi:MULTISPECIES: hypothetical protein [unclassified Burkholderia]|uniref:hypothetical protein n=1 Tax=unclassified Burkholderia TaxID=2613784 RepID=UPI002AB31950|nr:MULTISPECIES: hypothetical protein [unclassified Burkholderia]
MGGAFGYTHCDSASASASARLGSVSVSVSASTSTSARRGFGIGIGIGIDIDFDLDIGIVNTAVLTIGRIVCDGHAVIRSRPVAHERARIEESADDARNPQTFHVDFRR